ncbi:MAG TPA: polysaccharide deacetylase family protein, partial [Vicinamibacteria bacterium]|nr:polysaccharide deacetylase family protein [Vicinamibacteria bacterium]
TFFLIGARARPRPHLVARIRAEGHEVAHHHVANGTTVFQPMAAFEERFVATERILGLDRAPRRFFRPPGGLIRPDHARFVRARGYTIALGSAHPYDPSRPPVAYMRWLVAKNLEPGAIVVLHDGAGNRERLVAVVPEILEEGRKRGLRWVTLSELVSAADPLP